MIASMNKTAPEANINLAYKMNNDAIWLKSIDCNLISFEFLIVSSIIFVCLGNKTFKVFKAVTPIRTCTLVLVPKRYVCMPDSKWIRDLKWENDRKIFYDWKWIKFVQNTFD